MSRPNLSEEEKQFKLKENQEIELTCLHRQCNLLEKDRDLYNSGASLARMNRILTIYQKEHKNIMIDLEVANAPSKKREDVKVSNHLARILAVHNFYDDKIRKDRQHLQEMEAQIIKLEKEVFKLQSMQITDRQHEEKVSAAFKTVETLMNKLDTQNKKYGTVCAKNAALKVEIQRCLWERDIFMKIWNKLITKLTMGKKFLMDLIEQATIAYDQREEWCSKLQALRMKAHVDLVTHTQRMRDLKVQQDANEKLAAFFNIKGQKRIMCDLEQKKIKTREAYQERLKERLVQYKQFMADIYEFTKEKKVDVIAKKYYIQEHENFSTFTYANNMLLDIELLNDKLNNLHNEIAQKNDLSAMQTQQRQTTLDNLIDEKEDLSRELSYLQEELKSAENYIQSMLSGISKLFKICRCDMDPILCLLGDDKDVNVYNVMLYLQMIEQMVHNALVTVFYEEKHAFDRKKITHNQRVVNDDHRKREIEPLEKIVLSSPCSLCVQREFVADVVDTLQFPYTREDARKILEDRTRSCEVSETIHNVSKCFLPESRDILQRRYQ